MNEKRGFMSVRSSAIIACLVGVLDGSAQAQYSLFFADEFDGLAIDTSIWEHQIGDGSDYGLPPGWGNNELQYYTSDTFNAYVFDGSLHIVAREASIGGYDYTSARLRTKNALDFRYGRIEARIKLPRGQGFWPAFWMLPTNSPYGGWAASGEIDVMEAVNQMSAVHGTIHFGSTWPNNVSNGGSFADGTDFSQDFHIYTCEWTPDLIRWFVDGQEYHSVTSAAWHSSAAPSNPRAPFDTPFHLIVNLAVGGNWPGSPNGSTPFPSEMLIDWVRVYRIEQQPFGGVAHAVPGRIEAEDFDLGYPDEAYHDCDAGNVGSSYRTDVDVDIQPCSEGGFNVGWLCEGEWLEYTIDIAEAGTHDLSVRVASQTTGGTIRFELDGLDISGPVSVPVTGGWQTWTTIATHVELPAGEHVLRLNNASDAGFAFNLNYIEFARIDQGCNPADLAPAFGTLDFFDVLAFLQYFANGDARADITGDGGHDFFDVLAFLDLFTNGCP